MLRHFRFITWRSLKIKLPNGFKKGKSRMLKQFIWFPTDIGGIAKNHKTNRSAAEKSHCCNLHLQKLNIVYSQPFIGLFLALLKNTHHGIIPFPRQQLVYKTTAPVYNVMTCVMTHSSGMCVYNDCDLCATDAPSVFFYTNV